MDPAFVTHLHGDSLCGGGVFTAALEKKLPEVEFYKEMIELVRKSQIREIRLAAFDTICFNFMPYHFYNQVRKLIKTFAFPFPCRANF